MLPKSIEMKLLNEGDSNLSNRIFPANLIRMKTKFVYVNFVEAALSYKMKPEASFMKASGC